jgi:16S rRNA (guanine(1405)-N(7))-methyltransferase
LGCGFNPFSLPFIIEALKTRARSYPAASDILSVYHAIDICTQQAAFINRFLVMNGLPAAAVCMDLAGSQFVGLGDMIPGSDNVLLPVADLVFCFKLLPVLEAQTPGGGFALLRAAQAKHIVVTYPLKSLAGKEKGMAHHYRHTFETALSAGLLAPYTLLAETNIGTEWVIILH